MMQQSTVEDSEHQIRHAQRAAELLDSALSTLREQDDPASELGEIAQHLDEARKHLSAVAKQNGKSLASAVLSSNIALHTALTLFRKGPDLEGRKEQAVEALSRCQALLYPIARAHDASKAKAPPEPRERKQRNSDAPAAERRRSPRVDLETDVTFESASNFFTGFMEDISEGGLFVATYNLQPLGTKMDLRFTLPNGQVVQVEGEVRWLRDPRDENLDAPPGMGIMFGEIAPEDREAIQAFIEARSPLFFED